ncbi:MAG: hypothetical protein L6N95_04255 [Candidatus Methylarchaceae archaeon HK01B]|nr:hypothetical protein [Candidatus Methylarchaceae archaeon HK01M]MCP8311748.1 hypothetical protein [Candidatus Methylarchaceae archaeon HK02M1]MCP8319023.1 hypothetical protein [Candidatus Methylarchaceae archaeon HK01B]
MGTSKTAETRIDIFIRLIGAIFLILGILLAYFTATTSIVPQISPIYYLVSIICMISGLVALISRFE